MFSGIVETQSRILEAANDSASLVRIVVERPADYLDIHTGDSICSNGVCLTIETFDDERMTFALGAETLEITGWTADSLRGSTLNLERSLRMGDRIHGHLVTGHVDTTGTIEKITDLGGSTQIDIRISEATLAYIWKKGSWAVNGVSLTVNTVERDAGSIGSGGLVSSCLIPETLKRTNLGVAKVGTRVNIEVDMMARGLIQYFETARPELSRPDLSRPEGARR